MLFKLRLNVLSHARNARVLSIETETIAHHEIKIINNLQWVLVRIEIKFSFDCRKVHWSLDIVVIQGNIQLYDINGMQKGPSVS